MRRMHGGQSRPLLPRSIPLKNFEPISDFLHHSAPHPSENVINVRIQMYGTKLLHCPCRQLPIICHPDNLSSLQALTTALSDLDSLCETVEDAYLTSLREDRYERWEEKS
jgi:DNA-directed RNA polymerase I and III subunit RPAC2